MLQFWSPDCPKIYNVSISTPYDTITDGIGFRTIKVDGTKILLNGEPIFLRGICIHEETMDERAGRAFNEELKQYRLNQITVEMEILVARMDGES